MHAVGQIALTESQRILAVVIRRLVQPRELVSAENGMVLVALIIHPAQDDLLVAVLDARILHLSARIGRDGQLLHQSDCGRSELRRRNTIVLKGRKQVDLTCSRIALRRGNRGEVAGKHVGCWNECDVCGGSGKLGGSLKSAKEKQLVVLDRAADGAAELVPLERIALRRKSIPRIHRSVAKKFEDIAVKIVRAGFRHGIDGRRGMMAVLRRQRAGFDFEFLKRVGKRERQIEIVVGIVVCSAVEKIGHSAVEAACHHNLIRGIVPDA